MTLLQTAAYGLHEARPHTEFEKQHPTATLIIIDHAKRVMLVQSDKDQTGKTWGFPQRRYSGGDRALMRAIEKCIEDELHLGHRDLRPGHRAVIQLGEFTNPVSEDRRLSVKAKRLVFAGVVLGANAIPRVGQGITKFSFIDDGAAFERHTAALQRRNPEKWRAMAEAVNRLHKMGFVNMLVEVSPLVASAVN